MKLWPRLCFYSCLWFCQWGGAIPACIAGSIPACLAAGLWGCVPGPGRYLLPGGAWTRGVPGPGGTWSRGLCGLLLWPSIVVFCYALLLWPSGVAFWFGGLLIEGGLLVESGLLLLSRVKFQRKDQSVERNAYFYYFGQFRVFPLYFW